MGPWGPRKRNLQICEKRDTKGLYSKARLGEIKDFTGISSPYEIPENPDLNIDTGTKSLDECVENVVQKLIELGVFK